MTAFGAPPLLVSTRAPLVGTCAAPKHSVVHEKCSGDAAKSGYFASSRGLGVVEGLSPSEPASVVDAVMLRIRLASILLSLQFVPSRAKCTFKPGPGPAKSRLVAVFRYVG